MHNLIKCGRRVFARPALLLMAAILAGILVGGCSEDNTSGSIPESYLSACKEFGFRQFFDNTPPDQTCIKWEFLADDGYLKIKHINAGFNCCPEVGAIISKDGNTIIIEEREDLSGGACKCLCLFDFICYVAGVEAGQVYTIKILEPYFSVGDDSLIFTVDLSTAGSGEFCVNRNHYPWDETQLPAGGLISHSECGWSEKFPKPQSPVELDTVSCIMYQYDGSSRLDIKHSYVVLNCCPVFDAEIAVSGDLITVEVIDSLLNGGCKCICPFDLEYQITNLDPGEYTLMIIEPYLNNDEDTLRFSIDLFEDPADTFCLPRHYVYW